MRPVDRYTDLTSALTVDHDQFFKQLLREFLPEFLDLFFPAEAARLDLSQLEWLGQELPLDPPGGRKRVVDLLAKVATREGVPPQRPGDEPGCVLLLHAEVEAADRTTGLAPRLFDSYGALRRQHRRPVWAVVLYLNVGLEGCGWESYREDLWGRTLLRYDYAYVGLSGLDAEQYRHGANILGVALAALMRRPAGSRGRDKAEALTRVLDGAGSEWRQRLLGMCIDSYWRLDEAGEEEYLQMSTTTNRPAIWKVPLWGPELTGARDIVREVADAKFGPLPDWVEGRLKMMDGDQLGDLARTIVRAASLAEAGLTPPPPASA